jgi:hypothetical protein
MRSIGFTGRRTSGKTTSANYLVNKHGYTQLAIADRLKEAALTLDPFVAIDEHGDPVRLSHVVHKLGWDDAKESVPEVRQILQRLGYEAGRRMHGDHIWVGPVLEQIRNIDGPVAVSDVRFPNEIDELRRMGFLIVHVFRPTDHERTRLDLHPSEKSLQSRSDAILLNDGTLDTLYERLDRLIGGSE